MVVLGEMRENSPEEEYARRFRADKRLPIQMASTRPKTTFRKSRLFGPIDNIDGYATADRCVKFAQLTNRGKL
jgi:hypothetical protein